MEGCTNCAACEVRGHGVCSALADKELERLSRAAVKVTVPAGHVFIEEGSAAHDFFNVTGGTVKLFKSLPDGRRQITGFVGVGHFLGLAVSDHYAFGAESVEQVQLCRFSRTKLETLMEEFPSIERRLLAEAANELVAAQDQMLLLGRKTAHERVASFLCGRLVEKYGECMPPAADIFLPMTRADIADFLGLTVETVSRTFSRLRREHLIGAGAGQDIHIPSVSRLEAIGSGDG
ncbi:Crp/Fnr family transcriptional regulator [Acetobacter nitrogenifigens]|uniref:Crp/Fnr family transcriptional regulator n=1 Tax=Acetobacter nitrogenifigens TaxID=285268 RepID=UPI0015801C09|nr:Crp/Fnr family transcriptional regulator [Acetobacter nitrogenifigens]